MAEIDPSIALSYRPPNLAQMPNLQVQTPLESLARVVSLRSMMQEGQLKGLQLDQLRTQIQEQKNLADLMRSIYGVDTPTGTSTGTPASQTIIPGNVPGQAALTAPAPLPVQPPAPMAGGAPVTPAGVDVTAGLDKYLTPPTVAPQSQATPTQPLATTPVAPAPQPATVSASQFMAPQVGASGIPGWPSNLPTPAQIYRAAPTTGGAFIKSFTDQQRDLLDLYAKNQTIVKNKTEDFVRLANGMQDQDSFQHNLVDMARNGYITSDQARQYNDLGFDDPKTQAWLYSTRMQAVSADKAQEMRLALIDDARKGVMFNEQYPQAREARKQAAYTTASQSIGDLQDKKELPGWIANQDPAVLDRYGKYLNSDLPLDQIKRIVQEGAGAGPKAAETAATTRAQYEAGMEPYQQAINDVKTGKRKLLDLPQDIQQKIGPELIKEGYGLTQPGALGAPAGAPVAGGFGKLPSDPETEKLYAFDRASTVLDDTKEILDKQENKDRMGPFTGTRAYIDPKWSNDIKILRDKLLIQQAQLRKFAVDGQMRGVTPEMVDKLFPTILTNPEEAAGQISAWKDIITKERDAYRQNLINSGKIPQDTPQKLQAPPPSGGPGPAPSGAPASATEQPKPSPAAAPTTAVPPEAQKVLSSPKYATGHIHTLANGMKFYKTTDGKIVRIQ